MPCELINCCQFFNDNMKNMPKTVEHIKNKLCFGDHESCSRFRLYKEFGGGNIPPYHDPSDTEEVKKATQCLRKKHDPEK